MPSSPLGSTHGRTTSGVSSRNRLWAAQTLEQRRAWHAIITFGQHTRSNDVGRGMPSRPLDSTHGRTTLGMACHHHLWEAQTVRRHRAWHSIVALGRQISRMTSGVECHHVLRAWHAITALGQHTWSKDVGRGMPSPPLDSTHGRTMSAVEFHHRLWAAQTVERCRAWHAGLDLGHHTRSNEVGRGMPS